MWTKMLSLGPIASTTYKINQDECILLMLNAMLTNRTAVSLLFSLSVVEGLVPLLLGLPGILQDRAEDGLEQQDAQVDD